MLSLFLGSVLWLQQGCTGGPAPLSAFIPTWTTTITPTSTPTLLNTPVYATCTSTSTPGLIDDMEDNNNQVLTNQCRGGYWYNYNDGTTGGIQKTGGVTGPFTMGSPGVGYNGTGTSLHAVEVSTNTGFGSYAGFGFAFKNPQGNYNASGFNGFQFYVKNTTGAVTVSFQVTDNDVVNAVPAYSRGPHAYPVSFNPSWTLIRVPMTAFSGPTSALCASSYPTQPGCNTYGTPTVFDPGQLQQLQWALGPGIATDIWMDNISFY